MAASALRTRKPDTRRLEKHRAARFLDEQTTESQKASEDSVFPICHLTQLCQLEFCSAPRRTGVSELSAARRRGVSTAPKIFRHRGACKRRGGFVGAQNARISAN
jgi:hypothetical protein